MTAATDGATDGAAGDAAPAIRSLAPADLPGCVALSTAAHWNQNAADWQTMLALGHGWGIEDGMPGGRQLVASTLVLPYGGVAWISMVLVLPSHRGRGHAGRLLRHAIDWLRARDLTPVLDATPAGFPVYDGLGFASCWTFARWRRDGRDATPAPMPDVVGADDAPTIRPLAVSDWPAILAADHAAFGADRGALLRALAGRLPTVTRVAMRQDRLAGFVFARDGREATQVGPLWADDAVVAQHLLSAAIGAVPGPVFVDVADDHVGIRDWLAVRGFAPQRPFTRMWLAPGDRPAAPHGQYLLAGPELG